MYKNKTKHNILKNLKGYVISAKVCPDCDRRKSDLRQSRWHHVAFILVLTSNTVNLIPMFHLQHFVLVHRSLGLNNTLLFIVSSRTAEKL